MFHPDIQYFNNNAALQITVTNQVNRHKIFNCAKARKDYFLIGCAKQL